MPWKERYTISDEKSIVDADISWPGGKRCCFRVVVDLSPACGPDGIGPADYADGGMIQYLRTERIIPPYQTKGYKLVELLRIYEATTAKS